MAVVAPIPGICVFSLSIRQPFPGAPVSSPSLRGVHHGRLRNGLLSVDALVLVERLKLTVILDQAAAVAAPGGDAVPAEAAVDADLAAHRWAAHTLKDCSADANQREQSAVCAALSRRVSSTLVCL